MLKTWMGPNMVLICYDVHNEGHVYFIERDKLEKGRIEGRNMGLELGFNGCWMTDKEGKGIWVPGI